jgi:hypothetical protein
LNIVRHSFRRRVRRFSITVKNSPATTYGRQNAALGSCDEVDQFLNLRQKLNGASNVINCGSRQTMFVQASISRSQRVRRLPGDSSTLTSDGIVSFESTISNRCKRWDFLRHRLVTADDRQSTDTDILMDRATTAEKRLLADHAMTGEQGGIGHDDRIMQHAVVSDVSAAHQEAIVADTRGVFTAGFDRAMHRCGFSDDDIIADNQLAEHRISMKMLCRQPDISCRPDLAILANHGLTVQMRVFVDDRACTNSYVSLYDGVGTN